MAVLAGAVTLGVAGLVLVVGYLIRYRERVSLIAGYDPDSDVPPAVAGRVVGNAMLRVGVGTGIVGVAVGAGLDSPLLWGLYLLGVTAETGSAVYRLNTHPATAE